VDGTNLGSDQPAKKLAFKRAGPFPVIKKIGPSAYELKIPKMWKNLHPVINDSKLRPYHRPTFAQQQEASLTVIAPSQESTTQEVERILDSRRRGQPTVSCQVARTVVRRVYMGRPKRELSKGRRYVETSTTTIPMHPGFPRFEFPEGPTAKSRSRLRRESS